MVELNEAAYKEVQGLSRGLAILMTLSSCDCGRAPLNEISAKTGLHRTTVRRLLETLRAEGFVDRSADDGAFQLTQALKRLADRFSVYDRVAEIALPALEALSLQVTWPCALATPHEDTMVIRAATHHLSPLSFHRGMVGRKLPMLATAMGRAYLAFTSTSARKQTLDLIAAKYESGEVPTMSLSTFRQILAKTQEDGYGSNYGEWVDDKKVTAIAVPVRTKRGAVVGCINVVAVTRAIKPQQLALRFLDPLKSTASVIERLLGSDLG